MLRLDCSRKIVCCLVNIVNVDVIIVIVIVIAIDNDNRMIAQMTRRTCCP